MSHHTRTRRKGLCPCESCKGRTGDVHGTVRLAASCRCDYCQRAVDTYTRLRAYTREES